LAIENQTLARIDDRALIVRGNVQDLGQSLPAEVRISLADNHAVNLIAIDRPGGNPKLWLDKVSPSIKVDAALLQRPQSQSEIAEIAGQMLEEAQTVWGREWSPDMAGLRIVPVGSSEVLDVSLTFHSASIENAIEFMKRMWASTNTVFGDPRPSDAGLSDREAQVSVQAISRIAGILTTTALTSGRPIREIRLYVRTRAGRRVATITVMPDRFADSIVQTLEGHPSSMIQALSIN
jgi:hypothetical protein